MKKKIKENAKTFILFLIAFGLFSTCDYFICYTNEQTYIVTINKIEKERTTWNTDSETITEVKYIMRTTTDDGKELTVQNSELIFKNSDGLWNIQKNINVGAIYKITTLGNKIPILSYYPNIVNIEILKCGQWHNDYGELCNDNYNK